MFWVALNDFLIKVVILLFILLLSYYVFHPFEKAFLLHDGRFYGMIGLRKAFYGMMNE